jgi:para-aminobenzoate synthetase component 1
MHTRQLPLDIAPWTLFGALAHKERPFFIDAGQPWGDEWVSSMGFRPRMQFRISAGDLADPLAALDAALAPLAPPPGARRSTRPVPFAGGAIVALAYELKNDIECLPQRQIEDADAPHLVAAIYDAVVAYDHRRRVYHVATWHLDAAALARYAEEVLDAAAEAAARRRNEKAGITRAVPPLITANLDRGEYARRVERIRAYIAAGDVYQVNLSLRLCVPLGGEALDLYGNLRAAQPVPFGGYFDLGGTHVLSNSPELFLRRRGEHIETCPIKGTRRRGRTSAEDARLAAELCSDPKERAEHVMIVDLERNDLGRVCRTGSVGVARFAALASFRTLHHLVSIVQGRLPLAVTGGELLRAAFPSGSVTGAPKIRAMQIVDEVERGPRGFYTGALGWIDASGDLDLNVAIRTAVAAGSTLTYHAGSGIVADSQPGREHDEALLKAEAFVRGLGVAASSHAATAGGHLSQLGGRVS